MNFNETFIDQYLIDDHLAAVEHFWNRLKDRQFIKEGKHLGCYSVNEETFVASKDYELKDGKYIKSDTQEELEMIEEKNYIFELTA